MGTAVNFSTAVGSFVITLLIMNSCLLAVAARLVMISAGGRVIEKQPKKMQRPERPQDNLCPSAMEGRERDKLSKSEAGGNSLLLSLPSYKGFI